jgi:hypothetical protein
MTDQIATLRDLVAENAALRAEIMPPIEALLLDEGSTRDEMVFAINALRKHGDDRQKQLAARCASAMMHQDRVIESKVKPFLDGFGFTAMVIGLIAVIVWVAA